MKRTRTAVLVSYGGSSDSENEQETSPPNERTKKSSSAAVPAPPPPKKRKLPALPAHLVPTVPLDDPSKHQGRVRSTPHVDGQWAAYVYVPVALRGALRRVVSCALVIARGEVTGASVHTIGGGEAASGVDADAGVEDLCELHVSLTRPFFLRVSQREEMKRAVRDAAKAHPPFVASFATFSNLTNDERTRTFLCLEIGAGHQELRALSDALTPALHSLRQEEYYEQPRFHASFAWVLLDRTAARGSTSQSLEPLEPLSFTTRNGDPASENSKSFPSIPQLPANIVPALNAELGSQLNGPAGTFDVGEVRIRIGKDISSWGLSG